MRGDRRSGAPGLDIQSSVLEQGAVSLEGVCGTVFGGRFWSSEQGVLRLEGVCGTVFGDRFWSSERGALSLDGVFCLRFGDRFGAQSGELWVWSRFEGSVSELFSGLGFGAQSADL